MPEHRDRYGLNFAQLNDDNVMRLFSKEKKMKLAVITYYNNNRGLKLVFR